MFPKASRVFSALLFEHVIINVHDRDSNGSSSSASIIWSSSVKTSAPIVLELPLLQKLYKILKISATKLPEAMMSSQLKSDSAGLGSHILACATT
jgi:hypothetical protein